jgi:hypothetical protein
MRALFLGPSQNLAVTVCKNNATPFPKTTRALLSRPSQNLVATACQNDAALVLKTTRALLSGPFQHLTSVESGCVTSQALALSIRAMCKDLWKLLLDIYTSVLTEWNYESISYKPYVTAHEMPRITHHV